MNRKAAYTNLSNTYSCWQGHVMSVLPTDIKVNFSHPFRHAFTYASLLSGWNEAAILENTRGNTCNSVLNKRKEIPHINETGYSKPASCSNRLNIDYSKYSRKCCKGISKSCNLYLWICIKVICIKFHKACTHISFIWQWYPYRDDVFYMLHLSIHNKKPPGIFVNFSWWYDIIRQTLHDIFVMSLIFVKELFPWT